MYLPKNSLNTMQKLNFEHSNIFRLENITYIKLERINANDSNKENFVRAFGWYSGDLHVIQSNPCVLARIMYFKK